MKKKITRKDLDRLEEEEARTYKTWTDATMQMGKSDEQKSLLKKEHETAKEAYNEAAKILAEELCIKAKAVVDKTNAMTNKIAHEKYDMEAEIIKSFSAPDDDLIRVTSITIEGAMFIDSFREDVGFPSHCLPGIIEFMPSSLSHYIALATDKGLLVNNKAIQYIN